MLNSRFIFLPVAALVIAQPVQARVYMSLEQAQALMFPGAQFTPDFRTLTGEQAKAIEKLSGANVLNKEVRAWKASTGGWLIADQVIGKHDYIPFVLSLDESGKVRDVEILEYREAYGAEVIAPAWRAQFAGKDRESQLQLTKDIQNISGATLSSKHITDGVRRLVATHAVVFAHS
jgi:Na+-translocating ferredoxin:NAD+ oxidoreductase RnfG subunit